MICLSETDFVLSIVAGVLIFELFELYFMFKY